MESRIGIAFLNDYLFLLLSFILGGLMFGMCRILLSKKRFTNLKGVLPLEFRWTLFPGLILLVVGYVSLELLYTRDRTTSALTVKATGNQWY